MNAHQSKPIDYEALLRKYLAHVIDCEGWDFLENVDDECGPFTRAELRTLKRLAREAHQ